MHDQGFFTARFLLNAGAAAALAMAAGCLLFLVLYAPLPTGSTLVILALACLLLVAAAGLFRERSWAAVLACGAGLGFVAATLDITVFGYRSVGPVKYLVLLPALFLGTLPALPAVRTRFGFRPLSPRTLGILCFLVAAAGAFSLGGYFTLINARVASATIRLRSVPLETMVVAIAGDDRPYTWSERYNGLIPATGETIKRDGQTITVKTGPGEIVSLDRAPIFWDVDYGYFGYATIYDFEKAMWNAGYGQPALLMIKNRLATPGTRVYHFDGTPVRAVVSSHYNRSKRSWIVRASIFRDGDLGVTYLSMSPIRGRALSPVLRTIEEATARSRSVQGRLLPEAGTGPSDRPELTGPST